MTTTQWQKHLLIIKTVSIMSMTIKEYSCPKVNLKFGDLPLLFNYQTHELTKSSAITEGLHDSLCLLKSCQVLHSWHWKRWMIFKVTQCHWNCRYSIGYVSVSTSSFCSNNDSILHHFRDIATFTVYMSALDLDKSFIFKKTVEITSHVCFPIHV